MSTLQSLWKDNFTIEYTLPNGERVTERFKGSLRSAIRHALQRFNRATASFYTSRNYWLKEIGWNREGKQS
ncbi:hypothetical protein DOE73_26420 [Paenibacillus dendritiformis]|nr:hypothetical protein DOE73_26420 [Paenibacillus dendritiformis]